MTDDEHEPELAHYNWAGPWTVSTKIDPGRPDIESPWLAVLTTLLESHQLLVHLVIWQDQATRPC